MMFFFAALSARDDAFMTSASFFVFLAARIAISSWLRSIAFLENFLFETLSARFAVFVTGISFFLWSSIAYEL